MCYKSCQNLNSFQQQYFQVLFASLKLTFNIHRTSVFRSTMCTAKIVMVALEDYKLLFQLIWSYGCDNSGFCRWYAWAPGSRHQQKFCLITHLFAYNPCKNLSLTEFSKYSAQLGSHGVCVDMNDHHQYWEPLKTYLLFLTSSLAVIFSFNWTLQTLIPK